MSLGDPNLGSWFPSIYQLRFLEPIIEQLIIINWLEMETIDEATLAQYPVLRELRGWRNREVYEYIKSIDWTASIYE